jgi:putative peptide zinc metalloprotease protein
VLAIVALVVPVGGLVFMLVRATRSYGLRVWRATAGKPAQRVVAGVVVAGMVAQPRTTSPSRWSG